MGLIPMELRVQELAAKFYRHMGLIRNENIYATQLWNDIGVEKTLSFPLDMSMYELGKNTLLTKWMSGGPVDIKKDVQSHRMKHWREHDEKNPTNIGGMIRLDLEAHPHTIEQSANFGREEQRDINHWCIGAFTYHQPCHNCPEGMEVSRRHALECTAG